MSARPATTEPQTALPIEDQILEAIISGSLPAASDAPPHPTSPPNPISLANHFHLPISRVLDILAHPRTRNRLAADQELRDIDFHKRERLARDKALTALENILDTTEDPIEKRRAAIAILRKPSNRNPFWPRTPGGVGSGSGAADLLDLDEDNDSAPPRAPLPNPEYPKWCRPAHPTLIRLLTRLQDNHNPEPNAGLTTLFLHKHDTKNAGIDDLRDDIDDYLDDPGQEAELANFSCAILHTPDPATPASPSALCTQHSALTERVTLHWPDHHRTVLFHLTNGGNSNADHWKINHIEIGPKDSS